MKKITAYLILLLVILGALTGAPAYAQQADDPVQDAMYVYRNDGKFHGFFNSEVVRMEFSKVDTLGREHLDYVVQEIETIDSLYRIPISAIDSVSFYTPRTEYVPDVKVTTSSTMWDYVVASDSLTWITLSPSTPADLMPKVGDKLCTTKSRKLLPGGFYGTVQKVSSTAQGTKLECQNQGLRAYLKRHIFKGGLQVNEDERSLARRRMMERRNAPESSSVVHATMDTIKYDDAIEGEYEINDIFKVSGEMSTSVAFVPTIFASAFGAIGMTDGLNMDCALHVNAKTIADFIAKVKLEYSYDVPLSKRYIWITDTPFFVEIEPGIHYGMSGEIELNHHEEVAISATAAAAINESLFTNNVVAHANAKLLERKSESKLIGTFTGNFGPYFAVNLILGVEEIGKMGLRVEAGAKLVVTAEMALGEEQDTVDEVSTTAYDRLNLNGSVKIGPYGQVGYNWKFVEKFEDEDNIWEYDPGWEFEGGLVPKFKKINVYVQDPASKQIMFDAKVEGNVLFFIGGPLGFALYDDKGKEVARQFDTRTYFDPRLWDTYSLTFNNIEYDRWYTVHPVCHLMGYELVASPAEKFFAGVQDLIIEPNDSLKFDHNGGTKFISVKNTFSDNTTYSTGFVKDDWMTIEEVPGGFNVTVKPNKDTKRREVTITFTARDPNNMFNSRNREIIVHQDIDPAHIGLIMQKCEIYTETDEPREDLWIWTASDHELANNGRWDLWGFRPIIGHEDVQDAFDRNPVIKPNEDGTFTLEGEGLTIKGKFDPNPDGGKPLTGSGTFILDTDMQHHRKSKEDVEKMLHDGPMNNGPEQYLEFLNPALDEHYKRYVEGTVRVAWNEAKQVYLFGLYGEGTVTYDAECYWELCGLDPDYTQNSQNAFGHPQPNATLGQTKNVSISCKTIVDISNLYELNE